MTNIKQVAIDEILNEWFKTMVIKADEITFKYKIHNEKMKNQCKALRSLYFKNKHIQTFAVDYILQIYHILSNFVEKQKKRRNLSFNFIYIFF